MDGDAITTNNALHGFVIRLEGIAEERAALNADAKVIYDEARDAGYNVKALRQVVAERRMERDALHAWNARRHAAADARGKTPMSWQSSKPAST